MAETTPAVSRTEAGEAPVERAPSAEAKTAPVESAPETSKEQETEKVNGTQEKTSGEANVSEDKKESTDTPAEESKAPVEATDAKEPEATAAAPAESEATTAPEAQEAPPSSKKSGGSRRKSTSGVPEHKSKLSRKKSQARMANLHAKPGEYYLARLRSFPPWPSIICDEEILPQTLLSTRPVTAMRADGTYREDYADGGKRAHERTFPVMFLETNEFAWIPNTDLTPLDPASCKDVPEKGKSKQLLAAYAVAAEGHDLQYFKDLLADHQRALQQELEEQEAQQAAKEAAKAEREAKKNKRKSMDIADDLEDIDMEGADEPKKPKSSKKRKKDAETDGEAEKPAKTPKTATKLKLTTPKTPTTETEKKATGASRAKQTASGKKTGKGAVSDEGEEDAGAPPKEPEKHVDQGEAKERKQKEVLFVRHRLQKGFISRDQPPKEEEMTTMSSYFTRLEKVADDLEVSIIRATKINKVLKMIVKLNSIPRDEEFQFRRRAINILSKWKNVLDADTTTTPAEPKANGAHKEDSVETPAKTETEGEKEEEEIKPAKQDSVEPQDESMADVDVALEKAEAPEPAKEASEKEVPKTEEATEEKPAEEKAEEKAVEAAA
ncbi:hypothetical protein Aspvir_003091 [Aspergillus viridinutans]|uniref:PWWP domain-containing protein n=1 Tax=Aspergillus viridinutans TaxID=75553 RepID=A0A9P3C7E3_ASPVI|nr:uncharacterized protein Aspvir_003091 [Aspergillus viridinutans]GIK07427.1 hypothetical protein Aspvir_003091 [Aspergillus viridinutans]